MSLAALVLLPAVAGVALALAGAFVGDGEGERLERAAVPLAVAVAAVVLVMATVLAVIIAGTGAAARPSVSVPFLPGAPLTLAVDGLSAAVLVTVAAVALLALVFAWGDAAELGRARARFAGLMLLFTAAAVVTATATTLPALLGAWEVMGATSYGLIAFWWRDPTRVGSGATAFLTTRAGDLGLYLAVAAALAGGAVATAGGGNGAVVPLGSSLDLSALTEASPAWRSVVAAGILAAALGKAAQLPFSFWLSRAMQAPSPVSALLHSAAMVAMGGYLLLRTSPLLASTGWAGPTTAWVGALTAVALGAVALAQRDLKQLLAASTAAQLGFVVLAAGLGAVAGGTAHLIAHAATKALLFLAAGALLSALGTKALPALVGAGRRYRLVGITAGVGAVSLAGLPPLALWATKDEVLAAARESSTALYVVGLAGAVLSAGYATRVLVLLWRQAPEDVASRFDTERTGTRQVGRLEKVPLVVLAVGAASAGLLALPPLGPALGRLVGDAGAPTAGVGELVLSAALAVAVGALVWRYGRAEPAWTAAPIGRVLADWLSLERAAHAALVRPTLALAGALARFDDGVLDRAVEGSAAGTRRLAGALSVTDSRVVDGAVEGIARGARRLGALARRPQTGQLQQYYLQAVAVLALAVALLVAPLVLDRIG